MPARPVADAPSAAAPSLPPLPPWELRVSARARRVTLRVVAGRGLVVTVPRRFARRDVPGIVASHREWALAELAALEARVPPALRHWPPRLLELPATGRRLVIGFDPAPDGPAAPAVTAVTAPRAGGRAGTVASSLADETVLVLGCGPGDRDAGVAMLSAHLAGEARAHLRPRLAALAARHGLAYARVAIRGQRTLWGSCSSSGTISLNWKLLFLRPALVDYVLLHELAHTRHLDHSAAFWGLLERLVPGARTLDAELREAGPKVPPWLEGAGRGASPAGSPRDA